MNPVSSNAINTYTFTAVALSVMQQAPQSLQPRPVFGNPRCAHEASVFDQGPEAALQGLIATSPGGRSIAKVFDIRPERSSGSHYGDRLEWYQDRILSGERERVQRGSPPLEPRGLKEWLRSAVNAVRSILTDGDPLYTDWGRVHSYMQSANSSPEYRMLSRSAQSTMDRLLKAASYSAEVSKHSYGMFEPFSDPRLVVIGKTSNDRAARAIDPDVVQFGLHRLLSKAPEVGAAWLFMDFTDQRSIIAQILDSGVLDGFERKVDSVPTVTREGQSTSTTTYIEVDPFPESIREL